MVRVITQETFDGVVKENMEEFDMGKEEAIKEAKEQFETQVRFKPANIRCKYSLLIRLQIVRVLYLLTNFRASIYLT